MASEGRRVDDQDMLNSTLVMAWFDVVLLAANVVAWSFAAAAAV
jgi:hypothetical protein